jgi:hypothetical protein
LTSADGLVWSNDVAEVDNGGDDDRLLRGACVGVVDGQTTVLAVGGSALGVVRRSIDGGASWTVVDDELGWIGACAFNDDGVAVFVGSARSARSLDGGLTLVDHDTHFGEGGSWEMRDVIAVDSGFVAVGDLGASISSDGVAWTEPAGPAGLSRVASGNGILVAVGSGQLAHSPDGVTWTTLDAGGTVNDVVFAEGRFLIVGEGFTLSTVDGTAPQRQSAPAMGVVTVGVVDGQTVYVGSGWPDARSRSTDGITWSAVARDDRNAIADLVFLR